MKALMERAPLHRNVTDVQSRRMTDYTGADVFRVVEFVRRSDEAALGELAQHLGARALGFAKLKAMMVGRIVRIDLTQPIGDASRVVLVPDRRGGLI
ncbi:hypothetical protein D3C71_2001390 [compost metagenome]